MSSPIQFNSQSMPVPSSQLEVFADSSFSMGAKVLDGRRSLDIPGVHIWYETSSSYCDIPDDECLRGGQRKKCAACRLVVHESCMGILAKNKVSCKPTLREAALPGLGTNSVRHHWVWKKRIHGKCRTCSKAVQGKLGFTNSKDIFGVVCAWCKAMYHDRSECLPPTYETEGCSLGDCAGMVFTPTQIVRIHHAKGFLSCSLRRKSTRSKPSYKNKRLFVVKHEPEVTWKPVIVFINPKSGGQKGEELLKKFYWLLNPKQVFDLGQKEPGYGLDLYRKVQNLRILVCGGDGTVGWVLSEIDRLRLSNKPMVAVLPLGTGNDLARFLNWGGDYTDEPPSSILNKVQEGRPLLLDRWDLDVNPTSSDSASHDGISAKLPCSVMNNYFSIGADAEIALMFHLHRESNPRLCSNRMRNMMFYAAAGGKSVIQGRYKDLCNHISLLLVDGINITEKLHEIKPMSILFLNINKYSAGTNPWGNPSDTSNFLPQSSNDGYLEVIGLTSTSMVVNQVGGHGVRLQQCKQAMLITTKPLAVQVDGEPCKLLPSKITVKLKNQAIMISRSKNSNKVLSTEQQLASGSDTKVSFCLSSIPLREYEELESYDVGTIRSKSRFLMKLEVNQSQDLVQLRSLLQTKQNSDNPLQPPLPSNYCFLDATYAGRVYRIDQAQESLYDVSDIIMIGYIPLVDCDQESSDMKKILPDIDSVLAISSGVPAATIKTPEKTLSSMSLTVTDTTDHVCSSSDDEGSSSEEGSESDDYDPDNLTAEESSDNSINEEEIKRRQALFGCCHHDDAAKFDELIEAGVPYDIIDDEGCTLLHIAAAGNAKEIADRILKMATMDYLNKVDHQGQTALHKTCTWRRRYIGRALIKKGADLLVVDKEGRKASDIAMKSEDKDLGRYVLYHELIQQRKPIVPGGESSV